MKNKDQKTESLFKKKGFYVALYSCLGIVMISAAVFSFSSLLRNDSPAPIKSQAELGYEELDLNELQAVDMSSTRNYLTPEDKEESAALFPKATESPTPTPRPVVTAAPAAPAATSVPETTPKPVITQSPDISHEQQPTQQTTQQTEEAEATVNTSETEPEDDLEIATGDEYKEKFAAYTAETPMSWPVVGELVMDFSDSSLIYDKTLNQFRTNDNLCIGATIGTQVKATAEGIVKEITSTREKGNTIVIDHGNGWLTSYSELQDGILVKEGDYVTAGQVIGGVGAPSIYNVLMGSHLQFAVSKDGVMVDPKTLLAEN